MAIYRAWASVAGTFTNPGKAFDLSQGDTTTASVGTTSLATSRVHTWQNSTSLTGLTSCQIGIRLSVNVGEGSETTGNALLSYSWDGTNFTVLGLIDSDLAQTLVTYSIADYSGKNLNTLRFRAQVYPGSSYNPNLDKTTYNLSVCSIYDLYIEASAGPVYTVNAISGPTTVYAGYQGSYSTTVTNDPTDNSCTWSIVSGGGSLGAVTNDATSSRVMWTAPTAGASAVLRATCTHDVTKYAQITVTVPTVGVSLLAGNSRERAGGSGTYTASVSGHSDNRVTWSATGGSFSPNPANSTTWTAPSTPGKYIITGRHVFDTTKTFTYAVYVDWFYPTTATAGTSNANEVTTSLFTPTAIWDENTTTAAGATFVYSSSGQGAGWGWVDVAGFPSVENLVRVELSLRWLGDYASSLRYSLNSGATWSDVSLASAPSFYTTPQSVIIDSETPFNLNALVIRFRGAAQGFWDWDPGTHEQVFITEDSGVSIYDVYVKPLLRAYAPTLSTAPPTSPQRLYIPGNFNATTGILGSIGSTPTAIGGPGVLPYFVGSARL